MTKLSHIDNKGNAKMVDVSDKNDTMRSAKVSSTIQLDQFTFNLVQNNDIKKGDVLAVAKIAGIQAAKQTSNLIPLCHNVYISFVDVIFKFDSEKYQIEVFAEVKTTSNTGVEMEAFTACSIASLTIYDMVKSVQKDVVINEINLISKKGGKSGEFKRNDI